MQLNITTNYAIKVIVYIGMKEERVKGAEISKELDIPFNYLTKIMAVYRKNGIVHTKNGVDGGHIMIASPRTLNLYDIISMFESKIKILKCLEDEMVCEQLNLGCCFIQGYFKEFQFQFENYFKALSIEDLIYEYKNTIVRKILVD